MAAHIKTLLEQIRDEKDLSEENFALYQNAISNAPAGDQLTLVDFKMLTDCSNFGEMLDVATSILDDYVEKWASFGNPRTHEEWIGREFGKIKQPSYHFSFGNSTKGPVGYCARVNANTPEEAVEKLKNQVDAVGSWKFLGYTGEDDYIILEEWRGEYMEVYFNSEAISTKDIDEWTDENGEDWTWDEPTEAEVNKPIFPEEV